MEAFARLSRPAPATIYSLQFSPETDEHRYSKLGSLWDVHGQHSGFLNCLSLLGRFTLPAEALVDVTFPDLCYLSIAP